MKDSTNQPRSANVEQVALVAGATAGLGKEIAGSFASSGYRTVVVGREPKRVARAAGELSEGSSLGVVGYAADLIDRSQAIEMAAWIESTCGRLDVLVNCVGQSDRGWASELTPDRLDELVEANLLTAVNSTHACLPMLRLSRGSVVNLGSLASKFGSPRLGGYCAAKHALAGWTGQLRQELREEGVHVGFVCPGPIRRLDSGRRYSTRVGEAGLPSEALQPGAGVRLTGLEPSAVADSVLDCVRRRRSEILLPRKATWLRLAYGVNTVFGDWLLRRAVRSSSEQPNRDPA